MTIDEKHKLFKLDQKVTSMQSLMSEMYFPFYDKEVYETGDHKSLLKSQSYSKIDGCRSKSTFITLGISTFMNIAIRTYNCQFLRKIVGYYRAKIKSPPLRLT